MKGLIFLAFLFLSSFLFAQEEREEEGLTQEKIEELIKSEIQMEGSKEYFYDPKGRRDPFRSLLRFAKETQEECTEGTLCLYWDDITLKGIWKIKGNHIAQILSKQNEVYLVKEGDLLADGQILKISINCVFYRQRVNDPTKINPFQDVEKCLEKEETK